MTHPSSGNDALLWVTSLIDAANQRMRVVTWTDELDAHGELLRRQYRRLSLSWLTPEQWRDVLIGAGFTIEDCYGDYARTPFDAASASDQVWIARKARAS